MSNGLKGVFEFCTMLLDSCAAYGSEDANGVVATPDGAITYVYTRNSSSELSITQWQRQADNTYELASSGEVVDYQPILRNISPNGDYVSTDGTIYRTGDWQSVGSPDFNHRYSLDSHYVIRYGRHNSLDLYRIEPFTQLDSISLAEQLETAVPPIDIEYTRLVGFSPDGKWVLLQLGTFAAMIPIEPDSEPE